MINCGATADLASIARSDALTLYVVDCHKPYHHANVHAVGGQGGVTILGDGVESRLDVPTTADFEADSYGEESSGSSSNEDSDEDSDAERDVLEADSDSPAADRSLKRRRSARERRHARCVKRCCWCCKPLFGERRGVCSGFSRRVYRACRVNRRRLAYSYYDEGNFFGKPVSRLVYDLADDLNVQRNDLLWLAIVGTTSQYISQHVSRESYSEMYSELELNVRDYTGVESRPRQ